MSEKLPLKVFVFDVGQGDNLLLQLPDGSIGLIDFFHCDKRNPHGEPPSLTYIKHNAPENIGCAVFHLSHYHLDHVKGIDKWINWLKNKKTEQVWMPGTQDPSNTIKRLLDLMKDVPRVKKFVQGNIKLSDKFMRLASSYERSAYFQLSQLLKRVGTQNGQIKSMTIKVLPNAVRMPEVNAYCLAPTDNRVNNFIVNSNFMNIFLYLLGERKHLSSKGNDISAILLLVYDRFKLLFGGDTTYANILEGMKALVIAPEVCNYQTFKADFIKVPHHGSRHSSGPKIWGNILPQDSEAALIAISAGEHKTWDHPDQATLNHIHSAAGKNNAKVGIYSTNGKGNHPHPSIPLGEMRVKWPDGKKSREIADKFDKNPATTGLLAANQPSFSQEFLGYCFEFDPENSAEPIRVFRLIPD